MSSIITLLTDFGLKDAYVASLKGIVLGISSEAHIIDLTHLVPPQDIRAAGFILSTVYRDFPAGTTHLAVIDPGVGTERRGLVLSTAQYLFVGPDNGLFSRIMADEPEWSAWSLENPGFWRATVSPTFHGRDIFAPVAAHLANGVAPNRLGPPCTPLASPEAPIRHVGATLVGEVIHVDHFGNVITNFDHRTVQDFAPAARLSIQLADRTLQGLRTTYGREKPGALMAIIGSHGYLEVALNQGSAASALGVKPGDPVRLGQTTPE